MGVRLMVGTSRGGFWVTSGDRREWAIEGPFFKGWKVTAGLPSEHAYGGVRELTASGGSLREVLDDLVTREPRLKPHLFNEAGEFRRHVLCFHNGTNTRWMEGWDVPMSDGDTILFMQAVSGG